MVSAWHALVPAPRLIPAFTTLMLAFHPPDLYVFRGSSPVLFKIEFSAINMSQLSDMCGNADMCLNMMLWSRGGEAARRPGRDAAEAGDQIMSLRTKVVVSIAVAASAFLIAPAAAQAATHPVQVSGVKLKSALLPASTFGSGFKLLGASSSGKSLWPPKAAKHVPTMSCANFENQGLIRYGESAVATSVILNNGAANITSLSNLNLLYNQTVYQFPSAKAAAAFYNQAHAKFAACKSFSETASGGPDGKLTITLKSIAKTKVGTHQAFKIAQGIGDSGIPSVPLNFETLVTVAGADVFVVADFTTANQPVPAKTMLKLVNRVKALR